MCLLLSTYHHCHLVFIQLLVGQIFYFSGYSRRTGTGVARPIGKQIKDLTAHSGESVHNMYMYPHIYNDAFISYESS